MSYDFYVGTEVDGHPVALLDLNMTSNVAGMWNRAWRHASGHDPIPTEPDLDRDRFFKHAYPRGANGAPMNEMRAMLQKMFVYMTDKRDELEKLEPANGWGDWEGAREVIRKLWDAAIRWPSADLQIHS